MAITYKWSVADLERQASDGLVNIVHWRVDAVDGNFSAGKYGTIGLERGDSFVDFDDLTEATVVDWVKGALGEESVTAYENSLAAEIAAKKQPAILKGLPWAPVDVSESK